MVRLDYVVHQLTQAHARQLRIIPSLTSLPTLQLRDDLIKVKPCTGASLGQRHPAPTTIIYAQRLEHPRTARTLDDEIAHGRLRGNHLPSPLTQALGDSFTITNIVIVHSHVPVVSASPFVNDLSDATGCGGFGGWFPVPGGPHYLFRPRETVYPSGRPPTLSLFSTCPTIAPLELLSIFTISVIV